MTHTSLFRLLAWTALLMIALVTVGPIDLRPHSFLSPMSERFIGFAAISFVFAIAYPRRIPFVILAVFAAAVTLEWLQLLTATRHGHLFDLLAKLAGSGFGVCIGWLGIQICRPFTND